MHNNKMLQHCLLSGGYSICKKYQISLLLIFRSVRYNSQIINAVFKTQSVNGNNLNSVSPMKPTNTLYLIPKALYCS